MTDVLQNPEAQIREFLVGPLKDNQTWADLIDAFQQVTEANVENPIKQLELIRFMVTHNDDDILRYTARLLGFDLSQDVLNLNSASLTKIATQLSMYPDQNGTRLFSKFIELILNSTITVFELYSKNYAQFFEQPSGALITDSVHEEGHDPGAWFKTTHVNLQIVLHGLEGLRLNPGITIFDRIVELFYMFAPIALVIEHIDFGIELNGPGNPLGIGFSAKLLDPEYSFVLE